MATPRRPAPLSPLLLLAALLVLVAAVAAPRVALAQQVPGILQCAQAAESVDEDSLLLSLASCAAGTNEACCKSAQDLLQLGGPGALAGCPCLAAVLDATLTRVEQNELAKNFGVTRETVLTILRECDIKHAGGEGEDACPSSSSMHSFGGKFFGGGDSDGKHGKHGGGGRRRVFAAVVAA